VCSRNLKNEEALAHGGPQQNVFPRKFPENDENHVTLVTNTAKSLMELLKDPSLKRYYYTVFLSWYRFKTTGEIKF
jgi:hypothetical protein